MDKGKIMAEGAPAALIKKYSSKEVVEVRFGSAKNAEAAKKVEKLGDRIELLPDRILIYCEDGDKVLKQIAKLGLEPQTSLVRRSSLEDVFLRLTGRTLVD
jgi:lipooligosaccharide transport system ATP-binding protein